MRKPFEQSAVIVAPAGCLCALGASNQKRFVAAKGCADQ
jgi:hypothetical protein